MRLSWWLGRMRRATKRVAFLAVLIFVGYTLWMNIFHPIGSFGRSSEKVEVRTFASEGCQSKWLLVLGSNRTDDPCNSLAATFTGWTVLMINVDPKHQTRHSCCQYLSRNSTTQMLKQTGLSDVFLAGVMYAIQKSGTMIYIPPIDMDLWRLEVPVLPIKPQKSYLTASAMSAIFPAIRHFGCNSSSLKPHDIAEEETPEYKLTQASAPMIYAPADIHILPSQNARVFIKDDTIVLKSCDETAPSVALEEGTYGALRMDGAMTRYEALWTLSSCAVSQAPDCIAWNVVLQNLMWRSGHTVMVYYYKFPNSTPHSASSKLLTLKQFLTKWTCSEETFTCTLHILSKLVENGYLSEEFVSKQTAWMRALNAVDYQFPPMVYPKQLSHTQSSENVIFNAVNFSDNLPWLTGRNTPFSPVANSQLSKLFFEKVCGSSIPLNLPSSIHLNFSMPWMQMEDILLIVVFNSPYYDNIQHIEALYRTTFPRILYCGPAPFDFKEFPWAYDYTFSFIMYDGDTRQVPGSFSYECMVKAITMNYQVSGYLVIGDDVLILPSALGKFDRYSIWFPSPELIHIGEITKLRECRLGMCDFHTRWHWWEDFQQVTISALQDMKQKQDTETFYKCHQTLVKSNGGEMRPSGGYSDIYYIPMRYQKQVMELFDHFHQHGVFIEIAVPTVMTCLVGTAGWQALKGTDVQTLERDQPWKFFTNSHMLGKNYLHPVKYSYIKEVEEMRRFYCADVLPCVFDPYTRIERKKHNETLIRTGN